MTRSRKRTLILLNCIAIALALFTFHSHFLWSVSAKHRVPWAIESGLEAAEESGKLALTPMQRDEVLSALLYPMLREVRLPAQTLAIDVGIGLMLIGSVVVLLLTPNSRSAPATSA